MLEIYTMTPTWQDVQGKRKIQRVGHVTHEHIERAQANSVRSLTVASSEPEACRSCYRRHSAQDLDAMEAEVARVLETHSTQDSLGPVVFVEDSDLPAEF